MWNLSKAIALVRTISCHCLFLYVLLLNRLDMDLDKDSGGAERERTKNKDNASRLYELHPSLRYAACFGRYTWLVVSRGKETVWVMGAMINDGIAHNHPLLYTLLPISICLVLCLSISGRTGWTQHSHQRPPQCLSLGRTATTSCHFWNNCNISSSGLKVLIILWISAVSDALMFMSLFPGR